MSVPASAAAVLGWQAQLRLRFARQGPRTVLAECVHQGPLRVQRPFHPEHPSVCHAYLLHPPGGVVGGDELHLQAEIAPNAHALITTPAANKLYRSAGAQSRLSQQLRVEQGAMLEWLPQETIAFAGSHAELHTRVELAPQACFIGWDLLCLGRPAAGEAYAQGSCINHWEIHRDGELLWWESAHYDAELLEAAWGLRGQPVSAMLLATPAPADSVDRIRAALGEPQGAALWAVTQLPELLICRYLGPSVAQARAVLMQAWAVLRPALSPHPICPPRIWMT